MSAGLTDSGKMRMKIAALEKRLVERDELIERMRNALRLAKLSGKKTMSAVAWQAIESVLNSPKEGASQI